ncbi:MAG TPA: glutaredoxin family protein [Solimonas sp.]
MAEAARYLLLGRPDCHLCEDFEAALRNHLGGQASALEWADVDSRNEWRLRFGQRIPVLLNEAGSVLSEGQFDAAAFDAAIRR